MASSFSGMGMGMNPADQVAQSWKSVSEALKSAGEQAAERNKEIGMCVIKQAEKNASQLFETLQAMTTVRSPSDMYQIYSKYLNESMSTHAEQLKEITEIMAKTSKEAWAPITSAMQKVTMPKA